jgi:Phosphatidylserine decarboxylase
MGHVGRVVLEPDVGATLCEGREFGFSGFGGSDVITLFQKDMVEITAKVGQHCLEDEASEGASAERHQIDRASPG